MKKAEAAKPKILTTLMDIYVYDTNFILRLQKFIKVLEFKQVVLI